MKLKHIADFKVNNPEADFWITRKGSETTVGSPTREFSPEHIGVTVTRPDLVLPDYLFYVFQYFAQLGIFAQLSSGTTNLKNIKIDDVKNIPLRTA
jgi:restriction endonuclease S subunit